MKFEFLLLVFFRITYLFGHHSFFSLVTKNNLLMLANVMSTPDTRCIVVDYIQHQLRKRGLPWPGHEPLVESGDPNKVEQTMRLLGEEFEQRYTQVRSSEWRLSKIIMEPLCFYVKELSYFIANFG